MRNLFKTSLLIMLTVLFSSCATLFTKTKYPVTFNSNPTSAKLTITNKKGYEIFSGETPATVVLRSSNGFFSKAEYYIKMSLPGYKDFTTVITAELEGWYFGNIFLGGVIGMLIVDPASGAMWTIDEEFVNVEFVPETRSLQITPLDQLPDSLKESLVRIN